MTRKTYDPKRCSITWNGVTFDGTPVQTTTEFEPGEPALPDEGGAYLGGSVTIEELPGYLGTVRIPPALPDYRLDEIRRGYERLDAADADYYASGMGELLDEIGRLREAAAGADTLIRGYHTSGQYLGNARQFTLTHEGAAMLVRKLVEGERARCTAIIRAEAEDPYFTGSSRGDVLRQIAACLEAPGSTCRLTENARYEAMGEAMGEGDDE